MLFEMTPLAGGSFLVLRYIELHTYRNPQLVHLSCHAEMQTCRRPRYNVPFLVVEEDYSHRETDGRRTRGRLRFNTTGKIHHRISAKQAVKSIRLIACE